MRISGPQALRCPSTGKICRELESKVSSSETFPSFGLSCSLDKLCVELAFSVDSDSIRNLQSRQGRVCDLCQNLLL